MLGNETRMGWGRVGVPVFVGLLMMIQSHQFSRILHQTGSKFRGTRSTSAHQTVAENKVSMQLHLFSNKHKL